LPPGWKPCVIQHSGIQQWPGLGTTQCWPLLGNPTLGFELTLSWTGALPPALLTHVLMIRIISAC
jgi:hypothetical protein